MANPSTKRDGRKFVTLAMERDVDAGEGR
ncbi:hypothetical protein GWI33_012076, partial [Rhynchophorus ferrugineus]